MKRIIKISLFALVLAFVTTGCGTAKIQNVPAQPITVQISQQDAFKAIYRAGMARGWEMKKVTDGVIEGTYARRGFTVTISINYNASSYSISYKSSQGLKYDESTQTIHKNYNGWITRLKRQINGELALATASGGGNNYTPAPASAPTKSTAPKNKVNSQPTSDNAPASEW